MRDIVFRAIGLRLRKCLGDASKSEVDGFLVERRTTTDREDGYRERTEYCFELSTGPKSGRSDPEVVTEEKLRSPEFPEVPEEVPNFLMEHGS